MNITVRRDRVNRSRALIVAVDVSKAKLHVYGGMEVDGGVMELTEVIANRTGDIERCLKRCAAAASKMGAESVHVVCEPTGGYERNVLKTAHRLGCTTEYVSGQAVYYARKLENNGAGKTDRRDPRTIHTLARMGKVLKVRALSSQYRRLRFLGEVYEQEDREIVRVRNYLEATVRELFPDWPMHAGFLYTQVGGVVVGAYGCSPYRIVEEGWERFQMRLRSAGRGFRYETARKLWNAAQSSVLHCCDVDLEEILVRRVRELYGRWKRCNERREELKEHMEKLYAALPEAEQLESFPGVSRYMMARLVAETGPLSDFASPAQLLRYAGLNLREWESGTYKGRTRISKKGRALLRKVLYQIVFGSLIRKGRVYALRFQQKKADLANGLKAIVALMRHFLKAVYAMVKRKEPFAFDRLFTPKAAA